MSYEVIYDTIIATDGDKIIEFTRQCSNNCYPKPKKWEYMGIVYDKEKWQSLINNLLLCDDMHDGIKLNSRWVTYNQYGNYLKRKTNKAITLNEFMQNATIYHYGQEPKKVTLKENLIELLEKVPYEVAIHYYK